MLSLPDHDSESSRAIIDILLENLAAMNIDADSIDPCGTDHPESYSQDVTNDVTIYECVLAELQQAQQLLSDQALARSASQAAESDAKLIRKYQREEKHESRDRWLALELSKTKGNGVVGASGFGDVADTDDSDAELTSVTSAKDTLGNEDLTQTQENDDDSVCDEEYALQDISTSASRDRCFICLTELPPDWLLYMGCNHAYCRSCMRDLFKASFRDESLFPPRCCKNNIPITHNRFLNERLMTIYNAKAIEFGTPPGERVHCYQPRCGSFIPCNPAAVKGRIVDIVGCPTCSRRTCVRCKGREHIGEDCPPDEATLAVRELARENGWQECRKCRQVVELRIGCHHITCRCSFEFCYVCGVEWKNCQCPQWEERRLIARAEAVVDRGGVNQQNRPLAVANMQRILRNNHVCDHVHWNTLGGSRNCEDCGDRLPMYIYECRQCRILRCRRCRFNRA
ncbi:hypothetical protein CFIMG_003936RAa [Ceratocystis fimbriata CBS 114723]|uniref:RBR-type E3 ubiquitin transferase n=1 Tax=Ceratocystis fimbriata CBS 114723 TaxID=1035309 RepID=A0A2C5XFU7_9PEZI|nr:hypothetical protein CFIMG_003936RAa [Ceratocystis fimbriata CBS 114723]